MSYKLRLENKIVFCRLDFLHFPHHTSVKVGHMEKIMVNDWTSRSDQLQAVIYSLLDDSLVFLSFYSSL